MLLAYSQAKVEQLANDLVGKLAAMQTLMVTQKDVEAMKKEVALKDKELEDMRKKVETTDKSSSDLEVCTYPKTIFQRLLVLELSGMNT